MVELDLGGLRLDRNGFGWMDKILNENVFNGWNLNGIVFKGWYLYGIVFNGWYLHGIVFNEWNLDGIMFDLDGIVFNG